MTQQAKTNRSAVLRAAADLLACHGLGGLSIRAVAAKLQLAPNAIYHYYENLDSLKDAVAAQVCQDLLLCLEKACNDQPPVTAVRSLASAYLAFANCQRLRYEALLLPRPHEGEYSVAPERLWFFVVAQVRRVSGPRAAPEAAVALWAALHGLASLQSTEAFNQEKPIASIDFALTAWIEAAQAACRREQTVQLQINNLEGWR